MLVIWNFEFQIRSLFLEKRTKNEQTSAVDTTNKQEDEFGSIASERGLRTFKTKN